MTELEKSAFLRELTMHVKYGEMSHETTYQGAFDLLDCLLTKAGVIRDAKGAVLRAFTEKCLANSWCFPFEAGVITITKL